MQTMEQLRSGALAGASRVKLSCGLTTFPDEIFDLAGTLEILDLSGNALSALPRDLGRLRKLRIIFCSDNLFTELPAVLGDCPDLSMIGFKANRIADVSPQALTPKLRWLILTDNRIRSLPSEIGRCSRLQKLMLAGNQLTSLPETLSNCRRLELIRLSANLLTAFPACVLELPRLSWLAYSGNPFAVAREAAAVVDDAVRDIHWSDLDMDELLGQGASGFIHRARLRGDGQTARAVAVKLFKGAMTSDGTPASETAACMAAGLHPNLIAVDGRVTGHPAGTSGLVMQLIGPEFRNLAGPPSLETCTRDVYPADERFSLRTVLALAAGVASLARHLHERGIMHGDLYGHNTLHDGNGRALLGDFGAASFYERDSVMAQRLEAMEVRAFGCMLEELLERCTDDDHGSGVIASLKDIQSACLCDDPAARPEFAELNAQLEAIDL